jgi:hypothetical protein
VFPAGPQDTHTMDSYQPQDLTAAAPEPPDPDSRMPRQPRRMTATGRLGAQALPTERRQPPSARTPAQRTGAAPCRPAASAFQGHLPA